MDFVKNLTGGSKGNDNAQAADQTQGQQSGGGFMDNLTNKVSSWLLTIRNPTNYSQANNMAGGGAQGEKNEDGLDKGTWKHGASSLEPS